MCEYTYIQFICTPKTAEKYGREITDRCLTFFSGVSIYTDAHIHTHIA
jgi:hypothetical protein